MSATLARRSGTASNTTSKLDMVQLASEIALHKAELKDRSEALIESGIAKLRELRLKGMISKIGADSVCNDLILALQAIEEM